MKVRTQAGVRSSVWRMCVCVHSYVRGSDQSWFCVSQGDLPAGEHEQGHLLHHQLCSHHDYWMCEDMLCVYSLYGHTTHDISLLACCLIWINFLSTLFFLGSLVFFFSSSSLRSPLLCLSSEEAVSTFSFHFHLFLVRCLSVQFNLNPILLCLCVVWRHHRVNFFAGGVPAVGPAAFVVVLASLLHCGKFALQTLMFQPDNQTELPFHFIEFELLNKFEMKVIIERSGTRLHLSITA